MVCGVVFATIPRRNTLIGHNNFDFAGLAGLCNGGAAKISDTRSQNIFWIVG
jgi:hypothetical protein